MHGEIRIVLNILEKHLTWAKFSFTLKIKIKIKKSNKPNQTKKISAQGKEIRDELYPKFEYFLQKYIYGTPKRLSKFTIQFDGKNAPKPLHLKNIHARRLLQYKEEFIAIEVEEHRQVTTLMLFHLQKMFAIWNIWFVII